MKNLILKIGICVIVFGLWFGAIGQGIFPPKSVNVPATGFAAGTTNTTAGTAFIFNTESQLKGRWYVSARGQNGGTTGTWTIFYAISYDGTNFTTVNTYRYVELTPRGTNYSVESIPVDFSGCRAMKWWTAAIAATNTMTNVTSWLNLSN